MIMGEIPYVPFRNVKDGQEYIRISGYCVLVEDLGFRHARRTPDARLGDLLTLALMDGGKELNYRIYTVKNGHELPVKSEG